MSTTSGTSNATLSTDARAPQPVTSSSSTLTVENDPSVSTKAENGLLKRPALADSLPNDEHGPNSNATKKRKLDEGQNGVVNGNGESKKKRRKKKRKQSVTEAVNGNVGEKARSVSVIGTHIAFSLKGKEKAALPGEDITTIAPSVEEAASTSTPPAQAATDETTSLHAKISQQSSTIDKHSDFISSLLSTLMCQICYDPMLKPYTLAPCGHTACYICLMRWFRSPPAHMQIPPPRLRAHFDPNDQTLLLLESPMLRRKKKTCPQCRGVVREAPIEARELKSIAHALRASGLSSEMNVPADIAANIENANATADPWKGIFAKNHANGDPRHMADLLYARLNGADADVHAHDGEELEPEQGDVVGFGGDRGVYDPEDGVYRCTRCHHEIVAGSCTSCNRLYPGLMPRHRLDALDFFDAWGEEYSDGDDDWWEADEFDEGEDEIGELVRFFEQGGWRHPEPGGALGRGDRLRHVLVDEEHSVVGDDDEMEGSVVEEESYEGSFIDDEEDDGEVDAMVRRRSRSASRVSFRLTEDAEGEEHAYEDEHMDASDDEVVELPHPPRRRPGRAIYISDDEDEDGDEVVETLSGGARRPGEVIELVDSDDEVGSDEVISDDEGVHLHGIVDNGDGDTARSSDEESDDFVPRRPRYGRMNGR